MPTIRVQRGRLLAQLGVVLAALLVALAAQALPAPTADTSRPLTQGQWLISERPLSLAEARASDRWRPFGADDTNQGVNRHHYWLRFEIDNPAAQPARWILNSETSYLDHIVLYSRSDTGRDFQRLALSDRAPFDRRPIDYRTLSAPLGTPASGKTELYLNVYNEKPDSVSLRFTLYHPDDFAGKVQSEHGWLGLFYGALGTLIVVAVLFAVLLRQPTAFSYALFLVFTGLMWLSLNGVGYQYLWPANVYWHNEGFHLIYLGFSFFGLQFAKHFLQLKRLVPRFYQALNLVQWLAAAGILIRFLGFYRPTLEIAYAAMALQAILVPIASALAWWRGLNYAFWSLLAWLIYAAGLLFSLTSAYTNLLQWGMAPLAYLQVASLVETLLLMVGMAKWLVTMELERQRALIMANEDPLTGLGNRRWLQVAFARQAGQGAGRDQSLFLIMIDVDYFKAVNDRHGHDAGDCVLRELGLLLRQISRADDIVIRYGGEEFAILLWAPDIDTAVTIAERIRHQFAETPTEYEGQLIHHTLCCGIAEVDSRQIQLSERDMMRRADEALYQAKAAGRNQNHIYRPDASPAEAPQPG